MKRNEQLEERFKKLVEDHEAFFEYSEKPLRKALRINNIKAVKHELVGQLEEQDIKLSKIPWTRDGYWIEGDASDTVEYFLGHYYIQEASSMIPPEVLNPSREDFTLDAAAAPGGKTTQLADLMENKGCIIANEIDARRRASLRFNLSKHGVLNTIVASMDFSREVRTKQKFSRILLDAPCSCEGQFRKNPESLIQWSPTKIERCSRLQKKMIDNALQLLGNNGILVYSTCTLAPEENEEVVDYALKKGDVMIEHLGRQNFKYRKGVTEWNNKIFSKEVEHCARIYPQDNDSEGFFLAKMVKCES